jgi:hypothetical protein
MVLPISCFLLSSDSTSYLSPGRSALGFAFWDHTNPGLNRVFWFCRLSFLYLAVFGVKEFMPAGDLLEQSGVLLDKLVSR